MIFFSPFPLFFLWEECGSFEIGGFLHIKKITSLSPLSFQVSYLLKKDVELCACLTWLFLFTLFMWFVFYVLVLSSIFTSSISFSLLKSFFIRSNSDRIARSLRWLVSRNVWRILSFVSSLKLTRFYVQRYCSCFFFGYQRLFTLILLLVSPLAWFKYSLRLYDIFFNKFLSPYLFLAFMNRFGDCGGGFSVMESDFYWSPRSISDSSNSSRVFEQFNYSMQCTWDFCSIHHVGFRYKFLSLALPAWSWCDRNLRSSSCSSSLFVSRGHSIQVWNSRVFTSSLHSSTSWTGQWFWSWFG